MKVALQFDDPWDFTEHLAGEWWSGSLDADGWVALDEPFRFRGYEHRRVHVQPRHLGDELSQLAEDQPMTVNQLVQTSEGSFGLVGSIKRMEA